jgi:gluconate kinase
MVIIFMGVSGAGKTMVGCLFARAVGYQFYDADDFHPPANIDNMNPTLLESQFATLEEPQDAFWVDAALSPTDIVATIRRQLQI